MYLNPGASINLSHIPYADNPTLTFDSTTGLVTVTDAHLGRTVTIQDCCARRLEGGQFIVASGQTDEHLNSLRNRRSTY